MDRINKSLKKLKKDAEYNRDRLREMRDDVDEIKRKQDKEFKKFKKGL